MVWFLDCFLKYYLEGWHDRHLKGLSENIQEPQTISPGLIANRNVLGLTKLSVIERRSGLMDLKFSR